MKRIIDVRIFKGDELYIAEAPDLGVVTQGTTLDELTANLQEAIALALEGEDLTELGFVEHPTILATMELEPPVLDAKA
jgi:predicted RNase H-like HicB family nuclease